MEVGKKLYEVIGCRAEVFVYFVQRHIRALGIGWAWPSHD